MAMTEETAEYINKKNNLYREIVECLKCREDYSMWLVVGAIEISWLYKSKESLHQFVEFDKLLSTLHMCYKKDIGTLLEEVNEVVATDLLDWADCIDRIFKEWEKDKLGCDNPRSGKYFCL